MGGPGGLVAGAGIGVVFQEVVNAVKTLVSKARKFRPTRRKLASLVEHVKPVFKEMKELEEEMDDPKEETGRVMEEVEQGEKVVEKHSNVPWWKCCCLPCYQKKLQEKDEELARSLGLVTPVTTARDVKETLKRVKKIEGMQLGDMFKLKPPQKPDPTVGLDESLCKLKIEVLQKGVSLVGLTGMAGSGKTTLATLLCFDQQVKGKFGDNILFFQLSKTPDLKNVVRTLFQHYGRDVSDFLSDEHAVTQLKTLLEEHGKTPMMVVLDNVWPGSESLIDHFMVKLPDYKVVVTSRSDFRIFDTSCRLEPLGLEDSVTLFRQFALPNDGRRSYVPDDDFVNQIARNCWGSPLAIILIGKSLWRRPIEVWQKMRPLLSKGQSIVASNTDLLNALQKCLDDSLEDKPIIKECFMDLGLFPDNQKIPVAALIDMWTELYLPDINIDDGSINGMTNVHELNDLHLVNLIVARQMSSDVDNYYNHSFLVQHDLLREISIHQAEQQPFEQRKRLTFEITENSWPQQNNQNTVVRTLSISTDQMVNPDWSNIVKFEVVEVLVLNLRTSEYTLPEFIRKMSNLKVLIVTGYNGFHFSKLNNFEILSSLPCLRRIRLQQVSVPSLGELNNLRKLSLYMCNVSNAFESNPIPISNKLPNLVELSVDYCKDFVELPSGLCYITSLETLSITRCIKFSGVPKEIENLENLKVLRINSCAILEEMPASIGKLLQLNSLDISGCVSLDNLPDEIGNLLNLEMLHMTGCSKCIIPGSVMELRNLRRLICDEEVATCWKENFMPRLPNLRIEEITDHSLFI